MTSSIKSKAGKVLSSIFAVAALGGVGFGFYSLQNSVLPASAGVTYLENHGFTNVTPTGHSFFTACAKGEQPRSYMATDKKTGKREKETLCFGAFHRIHSPRLW